MNIDNMIMSIVIFTSGAIYLTGASLFQIQKEEKQSVIKGNSDFELHLQGCICGLTNVATETPVSALAKQNFDVAYLNSLLCISVP